MKPKLLSFDAAGTLIDVNWQPGRFAVECALELGLNIDQQVGMEMYDRLLHTRWRQYCLINQTRDDVLCDDFWKELAADWLSNFDYLETHAHHLVKVAHERLYGAGQSAFKLYEDVLPTLDELRKGGWRIVVLSNWDYSLHRILKQLGVSEYFEYVFASLQEGPEKPDPALFAIVCGKTGVAAEEIAHIGDNPLDDVQGAQNAGLQAIFLDRDRDGDVHLPSISTLRDLPKAIECLS